jgi:thymidine phosphorylase
MKDEKIIDVKPTQKNHPSDPSFKLNVKRLGIDTRNHLVCYMKDDCSVCKSEGFRSEARIKVSLGKRSIIATLNVITSPIIKTNEIGLSESAWKKLEADDGDEVGIFQAETLESFEYVRAKLSGKSLTEPGLKQIMADMKDGMYSDIQLSSFITACVDLTLNETILLTKTMSEAGKQLKWKQSQIVDKHCIGGLPGNRTSMLVVPIVAACGLIIPKTSSRAITSPSGTADTMEVIAPVNLSMQDMRRVVEKEGGCIVWGGTVDLSPVDDILVQVERALDLDSSKQLVASVLSKKIAAGSTDILIDIPIGPTAKVRSKKDAEVLKALFLSVGKALNLKIRIVFTDGSQPVGRGIGPSLEARDVLSVLRAEKDAPQDLRDRGLFLAAKIMEHCSGHTAEEAMRITKAILDDGRALLKFEAICEAQGGMREPKYATNKKIVIATKPGVITNIDNRKIARVAKLAGAPDSPEAGIDLHTPLGSRVELGYPLFTIYANSPGELDYALHYYNYHINQDMIIIGESNS